MNIGMLQAAVVFVASAAFALAIPGAVSFQRDTAGEQITGTLVDEATGQPVIGSVSYTIARHKEKWPEVRMGSVETDRLGNFLILDEDAPIDAPYTLIGISPGFGRALALVTDRGPTHVTLSLPKGAGVLGRIVDEAGEPIPISARGFNSIEVRYAEKLHSRLMARPDDMETLFNAGWRVATSEGKWERVVVNRDLDKRDIGDVRAPGVFQVMDIDPNRPFRLVAISADYGEVESGEMWLEPGQVVRDLRLVVRRR